MKSNVVNEELRWRRLVYCLVQSQSALVKYENHTLNASLVHPPPVISYKIRHTFISVVTLVAFGSLSFYFNFLSLLLTGISLPSSLNFHSCGSTRRHTPLPQSLPLSLGLNIL